MLATGLIFTGLLIGGALLTSALAAPETKRPPGRGSEARPSPRAPSPVASEEAAEKPEAPSEEASLALPETLPLSRPTELPIEADRNLRVTHAGAESRHAIVYLHGMCGNPKGADPWADLAAERATLITVRADVPCPDRPGYKWPQDVQAIQVRITKALEAVKQARGGLLATDEVTLIGYSQGAHRAERLAAAYPHLYRTVALGGPPTSPTPERLRHARRIAILGGELEDTTHMMDGYLDLTSAGLDAEFYLLPRAGHGSYGPSGRRIVGGMLDFLFGAEPKAP